jgi:ParB family chromosome partitioning protein
MSKSCKIPSCIRSVYAHELCKLHYTRQQRGTDLQKEVEWLEQLLTHRCGLKKCHRPVFLQGLCFHHFHQTMEAGLPEVLTDLLQEKSPRCQLKNCRKRGNDHGFCPTHAEQLRHLQSDKDLFDDAITEKTNSYTVREITLDQVDFDDTTYRMRQVIERSFVEDLARSIRKVGLLHAPILEEKPGGQYRIISGFCRCTALQLLAQSQPEYRQFKARIIDPDCFSHLELLKIAFEENDKRNYVNHLEKALKATQLKHRQTLTNREVAEVMDVTPRRVSELLSLVKRGHEQVLEALRDEDITFYHAQELLKIDKAKQPKWLQKVRDHNWSINQLRHALKERQQEKVETGIRDLLHNEIEGIEFEGSSTKRGPYPVKIEIRDRHTLRQFYRAFVREYFVE